MLRAELLARYPDATFYEDVARPTEDQMIALLADRDVAIVGLEPITERVLAALPNLKAIGKFGIGCEMIDFDAMVLPRDSVRLYAGHEQTASRGTDARLHDLDAAPGHAAQSRDARRCAAADARGARTE